MWRKSAIPHPNRRIIKLQTKNIAFVTNRHVAAYGNPHAERTKTNNRRNFDLLIRGGGLLRAKQKEKVRFSSFLPRPQSMLVDAHMLGTYPALPGPR
jgi:hypothetical protein